MLSRVPAVAKRLVDVHGLTIQPLETILKSVIRADAGSHMDVSDLCYHQKPCRSPCSVLPLILKVEEVSVPCCLF